MNYYTWPQAAQAAKVVTGEWTIGIVVTKKMRLNYLRWYAEAVNAGIVFG